MSQHNVDLRDFLKSHRYILGRKLGEGYFREVYEVVHSKGPLRKKLVAKVNHGKEKDSVQHQINLAKGDLHLRELETLNTLQHPNVIQIHDFLEDEKRFVVIEEHFDAVSLEDKVRVQGPLLNNSFFHNIFSQVTDALRYLHVDRKMLHRDLKPSNILVGRQLDLVKIIDFQNAAFYEEIEPKLLPTRGGTEYTHPDLLNSLLAGGSNRASIVSEFYALGATMFYALTGMSPFNYHLVNADNGAPLKIGDETRHVALLLGKEKLPRITAEIHEALLEEKIKPLPSQYRSLIHNCLSLQNKAYTSLNAKEAHTKFRENFQEAITSESAFPKSLEAMIQREVQLLPETKQPCFLDNADVISTIERIVNVIKQYGVRERKSDVSSSGIGSDAQYKAISEEMYVLADDTVRMELRDEVFHASDGTWSPSWSETYNRYLTVQMDGKAVLKAERRLEMESGNIHEDFGRQGALPWYVMTVEKPKRLMEIALDSFYIEDFGRIENFLEILKREDVQWRRANTSDMQERNYSVSPEGAYVATIKNLSVAVRVLPQGILKEGESIPMPKYRELRRQHGVRKTFLQNYRALLFPFYDEPGRFVLEYGAENDGASYIYGEYGWSSENDGLAMMEKIEALYKSVVLAVK